MAGSGGGGGSLEGTILDDLVDDDLGAYVEKTLTDTTEVVEETVVEPYVEPLVEVHAAAGDVIVDGATKLGDEITDVATDITDTATSGVLGALDDTVGAAGLNAAETLTPGGTTKDVIDATAAALGTVTDAVNEGISTGLDVVMGNVVDLSNILHPSNGTPNVEIEKEKLKVHKSRLKNKNKARLAVNTSQGRARKSLRIS
jgi:hypothetical protein